MPGDDTHIPIAIPPVTLPTDVTEYVPDNANVNCVCVQDNTLNVPLILVLLLVCNGVNPAIVINDPAIYGAEIKLLNVSVAMPAFTLNPVAVIDGTADIVNCVPEIVPVNEIVVVLGWIIVLRNSSPTIAVFSGTVIGNISLYAWNTS